MKNKICLITENFFPHVGGVEKYFLDVAHGLISHNYEVRIITSNSGGITGFHKFEGIDVYSYSWFCLSDHSIPKEKDLAEHVRWADLIHTTTYTAGPVSNYVGKKFHKPVIIIVHEVLGKKWHWIESNFFKALIFRFVEFFCVKQNYDFFLCNSYATEKDLNKIQKNKDKIKTIHLSVDTNLLKNVKADRNMFLDYFNILEDDKVFLYFGRPGQSKGIDVYLNALKKLALKKEIPQNVKFAFLLSLEPHNQRKSFIDKVKKYNLDNYLKIQPSVSRDKLFTMVKSADYVVVPSVTEGFGFSCVESCTLGCKVIHSSGGSLPEVSFGQTKEFENRNPDSLYSVLKNTIHNESFNLSEQKDFSLEKQITSLIDVYKNFLDDKL